MKTWLIDEVATSAIATSGGCTPATVTLNDESWACKDTCKTTLMSNDAWFQYSWAWLFWLIVNMNDNRDDGDDQRRGWWVGGEWPRRDRLSSGYKNLSNPKTTLLIFGVSLCSVTIPAHESTLRHLSLCVCCSRLQVASQALALSDSKPPLLAVYPCVVPVFANQFYRILFVFCVYPSVKDPFFLLIIYIFCLFYPSVKVSVNVLCFTWWVPFY